LSLAINIFDVRILNSKAESNILNKNKEGDYQDMIFKTNNNGFKSKIDVQLLKL